MAEYIVEMPFAWIYNEADGTKREPIVRCRDCKHMEEYDNGSRGSEFYCARCGHVKPDGFCAWGERK